MKNIGFKPYLMGAGVYGQHHGGKQRITPLQQVHLVTLLRDWGARVMQAG
jgi:hypothetical protein